MEWLWDEWAEGVLCGAIGVYVHVQGGGPGLWQGTGGEVVYYLEESGGGAWGVWLAEVRGVAREMGGGVWYLPGIFRLGSALGGGGCGSPWIASCA